MAALTVSDLSNAALHARITLPGAHAALIVRDAAAFLSQNGPRLVGERTVLLSSDGAVSVSSDAPGVEQARATRGLRSLLDLLLEHARDSTGGLRLCACRLEDTTLELLMSELDAQLRNHDLDELRGRLGALVSATESLREQGLLSPVLVVEEAPPPPSTKQSSAAEIDVARLTAERQEFEAEAARLSAALALAQEERRSAFGKLEAAARARDQAMDDARRLSQSLHALQETAEQLSAERQNDRRRLARVEELEAEVVALTASRNAERAEARSFEHLEKGNHELAADLAKKHAEALRLRVELSAVEGQLQEEREGRRRAELSATELSEAAQQAEVLREKQAELLATIEHLRLRLSAVEGTDVTLLGGLETERRSTLERAQKAELALKDALSQLEEARTRLAAILAEGLQSALERTAAEKTQVESELAETRQTLNDEREKNALMLGRQKAAEKERERERLAAAQARNLEHLMLRAELEERAKLAESRISAACDAISAQLQAKSKADAARIERLELDVHNLEAARKLETATLRASNDRLIEQQEARMQAQLEAERQTHLQQIAEKDRLFAHSAEVLAAQHRAAMAVKNAEAESLLAAMEQKVRQSQADKEEAERQLSRATQLALLEVESLRGKRLEDAHEKLRKSLELSQARALDDLRAQHDVDLAAIRAETQNERENLKRRVEDLELQLARATSERDAERAWRVDGEAAAAAKIRELRRNLPSRGENIVSTYRGEGDLEEARKWWK